MKKLPVLNYENHLIQNKWNQFHLKIQNLGIRFMKLE